MSTFERIKARLLLWVFNPMIRVIETRTEIQIQRIANAIEGMQEKLISDLRSIETISSGHHRWHQSEMEELNKSILGLKQDILQLRMRLAQLQSLTFGDRENWMGDLPRAPKTFTVEDRQ